MVLIMIANIELDSIQNSIVTICFLRLIHKVMFLYPAAAKWVKTNGKHKAGEHIKHGYRPEKIPHQPGKDQLRTKIDNHPFVNGRYFFEPECPAYLENGE